MAARKPKPKPPVCKIAGCTGRIYVRGLCALHWCGRADQADPVPAAPVRPPSTEGGPVTAETPRRGRKGR